MAGHTSYEYASFILKSIPDLFRIESVKRLFDITEDPGDDPDKTAARDKAVMEAIWDIRDSVSEKDGTKSLIEAKYDDMEQTDGYIKGKKGKLPFNVDGIVWNTLLEEKGIEPPSASRGGMKYANAFDHALTYFITRGWGLSRKYITPSLARSLAKDKNGWEFNCVINPQDFSIWLSVVEALHNEDVIPDKPWEDIVELLPQSEGEEIDSSAIRKVMYEAMDGAMK